MRFILFVVAIFLSLHSYTQFTNITDNSGVLHAHVNGQLMGGGIIVFDYNNDGFDDLFLTGGVAKDKLYRNNGNNTFTNVGDIFPYNINKHEVTTGAAAGDFNKDGCTDLIITAFNREDHNILLRNNCDGTFTDLTRRAGIVDYGPSIGATLVDYDKDGDLDIYVINYIQNGELIHDEDNNIIGFAHECAPNFFYENEGNFFFTERSEDLGLRGGGCALATTSFSFLTDRDPAIYVANDFGEWVQPNELFVYDSQLDTFIDRSVEFGLDIGLYGMGIAIGDPDQDNDFDFYVTNLGSNAYLQNSNNYFTNKSFEKGIDITNTPDSSLSVSWGTIFFDANNDTYQDLFVANGYIPSAAFIKTSFVDPSKFYLNSGGDFRDVSEGNHVNLENTNRGVAYTDLDRNGTLDLIISGLGANADTPTETTKYKIFKNMNIGNNYLSIDPIGGVNAVEAFGTIAELYTEGKKYSQCLYANGTYCSQNTGNIHFGLFDHTFVDSLIITWPNDMVTRYYDLPVNQEVAVYEDGSYQIKGCMDASNPNYNPLATYNTGCFFDYSTSTEDLVFDDYFSLYPTLANNVIYLESKESIRDYQLNIFNIFGQLVKSVPSAMLSSNVNPIDVSFFPVGTYMVQINDGKNIYTRSIVISEE